jgi:AraC family transcriptional regulator of adaptative response/methylated-DNA-[protein]-cysteine methyltransferase
MQRAVSEVRTSTRRAELVKRVCDYLRENSASKITLASLGERFGLSPFHLQRIFSDVMGMSPREYLAQCRLNALRIRLAKGEPVLNALRGSGYSSQSWLYQDSRKQAWNEPPGHIGTEGKGP